MRTYLCSLRTVLSVGLAVVVVIATASLAFAHAQYASSTPAANATVASLPSTLQVTFTEELASIQFTITGPDGSNAAAGSASIDLAHRTDASVGLRDAGPGQYTVVWHNVSSDDGDPNDGSFVFNLAAPTGQAQPATTAPSTATTTAAPSAQPAAPEPTCIESGVKTPGINDVRVDTYCKRQAIRDKFRGKIDEKTFNYLLSIGKGLDSALEEAMAALKGGR